METDRLIAGAEANSGQSAIAGAVPASVRMGSIEPDTDVGAVERVAEADERTRVMRDGVLNYAGVVVSSAVGIVVIPLLLRGLGADHYGFWIFAGSIATWFSTILDLGLFWSVTREIASEANGTNTGDSVRVVAAAGNASLLGAIAGAALIPLTGLFFIHKMAASGGGSFSAVVVFALAGGAFAGIR